MTAMTYDEIERAYPDEWVLIVDPVWTGDESMEGGTVAFASSDREAVERRASALRPSAFGIFFTGALLAPDCDGVLL